MCFPFVVKAKATLFVNSFSHCLPPAYPLGACASEWRGGCEAYLPATHYHPSEHMGDFEDYANTGKQELDLLLRLDANSSWIISIFQLIFFKEKKKKQL